MLNIKKIVTIIILFSFILLQFNILSNFSASSNQEQSFVKYTLYLNNNTLFPGNENFNKSVQYSIQPSGMAYCLSNGDLYVLGISPSKLFVINAETDKITKVISLPPNSEPWSIVYKPNGNLMYIMNNGYTLVLNCSTDEINGQINNTGIGYGQMLFNEQNNCLYISSMYALTVLNTENNSIITHINLPDGDSYIAYNPNNKEIYIPNSGEMFYPNGSYQIWHNVTVISTKNNKILGSINVGEKPFGILYDPINNYIYVGNEFSKNITIINGNSNIVIGNINLPYNPYALTLDPLNNYIYVINTVIFDNGSESGLFNGKVTVINGNYNKIINSFNVGINPISIIYAPNNYIYVSNTFSGTALGTSGTISVITTSNITNNSGIQLFNFIWVIIIIFVIIAIPLIIIFFKKSKIK